MYLSNDQKSQFADLSFSIIKDLFPIHRSLAGPGIRYSLEYLSDLLPKLKIRGFRSGLKVNDWEVPMEWIIKDAWLKDKSGNKIVDYTRSNLSVVGYSAPINIPRISKSKLESYIFTDSSRPHAIPYVTSYYKRRSGLCMPHSQWQSLPDDDYELYIDSYFTPGVMNYGELLVKGVRKDEILISTYLCHPSMANNELSGPAVVASLAKIVSTLQLNHSVRFLFLPETIGSIAYISKNIRHLKRYVKAGYVVTCIGDSGHHSLIPSRYSNTISDKAAKDIFASLNSPFNMYSWLDRGSDERQYCAPGVDLPIASVTRSKHGCYPEYHTSDDDLSIISIKSLGDSIDALLKMIILIDGNVFPLSLTKCEPFLSQYGLYPTLSERGSTQGIRGLLDIISYCDGNNDIFEISDLVNLPSLQVLDSVKMLESVGLLKCLNKKRN